MNTSLNVITIAAAAAMLGACASRVTTHEVVREQPIVQQAQPSVVERVTVVQPPPAPSEQMPPAPAAVGYSWVPGHYVWRDSSWHWEAGQWRAGSIRPMPPALQESPPPPIQPGARWVPGYWNFVGNDWVWVNGRWQ
ncbi:MAG TPA: hypothetical protein VKI18_05075 [Albitalea sp.]|nr:hypothetical protein [Albitalea sp.]